MGLDLSIFLGILRLPMENKVICNGMDLIFIS